MAYSDDRTPEQIEREIERTRQDTAATLAAIEERLSPGRLMDEAWAYLRSSGQGQSFMTNLSQTVRDNPIPVALLAISVVWLAIAGSRKDKSRADGFDRDYDYDYGEDAVLTEDAFRQGGTAFRNGGTAFRQGGPRGRVGAAEYVDPDTHHTHVSSSRANAPAGTAPSPDTLLGRERSGLSAGEAARVFETPGSGGTSKTETSTLVTPADNRSGVVDRAASHLRRPGE
jgi:hypothetical protein